MHMRRGFLPAVTVVLLLSVWGCSRPSPTQTNQALNSQATSTTTNDATGPANTETPDASNVAAERGSNQVEVAEPLTIPAGTMITVRLQQSLSSASSQPGERFDAVIDQPVAVGDRIVLPVGTVVSGHVTVARRSGRLHHPGELGLALDSVTLGQRQFPLTTASVVARGRSHKKRNWAWIGGGAGGGALIGALAGGGKGALIGGPIGAAAGTTTAFITGKRDVGFGAERRVTFRLRSDVNLA